jgi:multidrug efflux system membrane fusion protein
LIILVILFVAAGWAAIRWDQIRPIVSVWLTGSATAAAPATSAIPVQIATATTSDIDRIIAGIGTVSPLNTVTVRAQVDGAVTAIPFSEGDVVHQGDVLVQVDPQQMQTLLAAAEAKVQQDEAQLAYARTDAERYVQLAKIAGGQGGVAPATLDQKLAAVTQLEAQLKSDQATSDNLRGKLAFATIRAPISGRTGFRSVELGGLVSSTATTGIVTITQLDPIGLVFVAPGDRFGEIQAALKAGIAKVDALATDTSRVLAHGKLTLMDNNIDSLNGSIRLRATFDNKEGVLWPGLPVATRLTVAAEHGVVVPDSVILRGTDGLYAYVVTSDNKTSRRPLEVAFVTDGKALVTKGLTVGDRVVSTGRDQVGDGTAVAISQDDPAETHGSVSATTAKATP